MKKGTSFSYYIETCLVVDSTDSWIVDSGATNHICNSLQGFQIMQKIEKGGLPLESELELKFGQLQWELLPYIFHVIGY